jgi:hypothetical protein
MFIPYDPDAPKPSITFSPPDPRYDLGWTPKPRTNGDDILDEIKRETTGIAIRLDTRIFGPRARLIHGCTNDPIPLRYRTPMRAEDV